MKEQIIRFFKMWTLPLGMFAGVGVYLMFHYIPWLSPLKVLAKGANDYILPLMVFIQLFTTFCKVNPRKMRMQMAHHHDNGAIGLLSGSGIAHSLFPGLLL